MIKVVVDCSEKLALALGTKGLVNIQYLIYGNELYVIEVNPRASRTVPYLSKVTGISMVTVASRIMMGAKLSELGYSSGLCDTPPYYTVKVPVFSFEKLSDANSQLGPEMKSTGEVLGIGRTLAEALFKGFAAAGYKISSGADISKKGVLLSVDNHELPEVISLAKKLSDIKLKIYATPDTADVVSSLGIKVTRVNKEQTFDMLKNGELSLVIYTGALYDDTLAEYIELHGHCVRSGVPTITSLDTAGAMADMLISRYNTGNTELVDLNDMRKERKLLHFAKMQGTGNDYIFFDNRDGCIEAPGSLAVSICDRHYGIGGYGVVLMENSDIADAKMRIFNRDGSEGRMAGNSIRCVGKYLYDKGIVKKEEMTIETDTGIKTLKLYLRNGRVSTATVDMGKADLNPKNLPSTFDGEAVIDRPAVIGGQEYKITCASVGNPHCVVFTEDIDSLDLDRIGPDFENAVYFPERINTEFVRIVNDNTLRMRVFERGNGETWACGTGACAAVIAATEKGLFKKGMDVTTKLIGGDLIVNYTDERVTLTGDAVLVYEGFFEF
jgi:carbamoyl-phosphate synthase large subunit